MLKHFLVLHLCHNIGFGDSTVPPCAAARALYRHANIQLRCKIVDQLFIYIYIYIKKSRLLD